MKNLLYMICDMYINEIDFVATEGLGKMTDAFAQGLTINNNHVVKEIRYDPKGYLFFRL